MFAPVPVTLFVVSASVVLFLAIEWQAKVQGRRALARWRRWLIPVPALLLLAANLDGVLSCLEYARTHPIVAARYSEYEAWNSDRLIYAGLIALVVLPFFLVSPSAFAQRRFVQAGFVLFVWFGYVVWFFPFVVLLLATGVPLSQ